MRGPIPPDLFTHTLNSLPCSYHCFVEQQITLYPHRDENNNFQVLNVSSTSTIVPLDWTLPEPVYLKDGDQIRLEHVSSKKRVHSHDVRPPISEVDFQNEVSGYGFEGFEGDACAPTSSDVSRPLPPDACSCTPSATTSLSSSSRTRSRAGLVRTF